MLGIQRHALSQTTPHLHAPQSSRILALTSHFVNQRLQTSGARIALDSAYELTSLQESQQEEFSRSSFFLAVHLPGILAEST